MPHISRRAVLALTIAASVAIGLAASNRGEATEAKPSIAALGICANAEWPVIPPICLDGGSAKVRYVSVDAPTYTIGALALRFSTDFQ